MALAKYAHSNATFPKGITSLKNYLNTLIADICMFSLNSEDCDPEFGIL